VERNEIDLERLRCQPVGAWKGHGLLLAVGDFAGGAYTVMTVGWGGLGHMWKRPLAVIVVRPSRYTYEFMERYPDFTLSRFSPAFADKLAYCGSHTGRKVDKIRKTGLTPMASQRAASPSFAEAELVLECRKTYWSDLEPGHFLVEYIESNYSAKDYHRIYFGEVLAAFGTAAYQA